MKELRLNDSCLKKEAASLAENGFLPMTRALICFLPLFFCAQAFAWDMQMYMPVDENGNQVQLNRTHDDGKNKLVLKPGEIDSTEIYYNLIADENLDASYSQNVTGMIWGGALTGGGNGGLCRWTDNWQEPRR